MKPAFFRTDIDANEEATFRAHARDNYVIGDPIDPEGIKHPIWVHEAATMNLEAWRLEYLRAQQDDKTIDIEDVTIDIEDVELIAADLMSEHGENPEYDRALVELVATVRGLSPADNRKSIEARLRAIGFPQNRSMVWGL